MSNGKSYIPAREDAFNKWQNNLMAYLPSRLSTWNVPTGVFEKLPPLKTTWDDAYTVAINPETRTKATVQAKNEAKKMYTGELRTFIKAYITYNPVVTDADRNNMGLPIHDTKPTPIPVPESTPIGEVDFSKRQKHLITVRDISGKSKPEKVHGFEVWRKIGGEAPAGDSDFSYAGFSTKSPFTIDYSLSDAGKTVYYRFHWVNAKNQPGPWSEVVNAIIA